MEYPRKFEPCPQQVKTFFWPIRYAYDFGELDELNGFNVVRWVDKGGLHRWLERRVVSRVSGLRQLNYRRSVVAYSRHRFVGFLEDLRKDQVYGNRIEYK